MKSMRLRSPTGRSSPAGRSMWRARSRGASCPRCRISAGRSRCSPAGSSLPIAAIMAIAATFTGSSWAFPRAIRRRSRVSRPGRAAAASGDKAGSPAMASRCSRRPATRSAPAAWGDGEAVLRFGPSLARPAAPRDYFAPSNWSLLDRGDQDLGATAPIPIDVPSAKGVRKLIFAIGKTGDAYLLDRDNLGGIGHPLLERACDHAPGDNVAGGMERGRQRVRRARRPRRELSARQGGERTCDAEDSGRANASRSRPPGAPRSPTARVRRSSPPPTATQIRSCSSSAPSRTTRSMPSGATTANSIASAQQPLRGFDRYQTPIAAGDRLYVASGGQVYAFTF